VPQHRNRRYRMLLAALLVALASVPGCSSGALGTAPPTIEPARPAVSPPQSLPPAGTVRPFTGDAAVAMFDPDTAQLVALTPGADQHSPATLTLLRAGRDRPRILALPGPATALTGDGRGTAYLSARGGYFTVELSSGRINRVGVDGAADTEFTAIARRADGELVLGSADGAVYTLVSETAVAHRSEIFARVDSLVAQGDTVAVLDRGQTSVTTIGPDGKPRYALRAGTGATTLAADPRGLVLVADTRGGQLLVYGVEPLMLRQAYPVHEAPYGLVGSGDLVWVSQTAANTVIGYDLATGIPVEKVRYPTVRQPNALAYDETSDTLYVVSGAGAGIQVVEHAAGTR
jgi:hypothetical protein